MNKFEKKYRFIFVFVSTMFYLYLALAIIQWDVIKIVIGIALLLYFYLKLQPSIFKNFEEQEKLWKKHGEMDELGVIGDKPKGQYNRMGK